MTIPQELGTIGDQWSGGPIYHHEDDDLNDSKWFPLISQNTPSGN